MGLRRGELRAQWSGVHSVVPAGSGPDCRRDSQSGGSSTWRHASPGGACLVAETTANHAADSGDVLGRASRRERCSSRPATERRGVRTTEPSAPVSGDAVIAPSYLTGELIHVLELQQPRSRKQSDQLAGDPAQLELRLLGFELGLKES